MPAKIYDWDEWFALGGFTLVRGEDYVCSQSAICQQVRSAASNRKLSVSIVEADNAVIVEVLDHAASK